MVKWQQAVHLLAHYWKSVDKKRGALLAAGILALGLSETWLLVQYNNWYASFYNSLQQGKAEQFWAVVPILLLLLSASIFSQVTKEFLDSWLQLRWRRVTTDRMIQHWLSRKAFYRIERDNIGDNPDQRISEDVSVLINLTMELTLRLVTTVASLSSFGYITWTKGGDLNTEIGSLSLHIPGYMFWVAVTYALIDCLVTHFAGRSLLTLNVRREATEAEMRYSLMQVRENAEQIALYHGEPIEHERLLQRFGAIWRVSKKLFIANAKVGFVTGTSNRIMVILPLLLMAPNLLSGQMDLGTMIATSSAWAVTALGLAWFAKNYTQIAQWKAAALRLIMLEQAIDTTTKETLQVSEGPERSLNSSALSLNLPSGELLMEVGSVQFRERERWLIQGKSGAGKSTLLRAIAGLWPYGTGFICVPNQTSRLFLPQKSYIPHGVLKDALCYPSQSGTFSDEECIAALIDCRLESLTTALYSEDKWSNRLSVGEQQRFAFARVFLQSPDFLFMDEATSALDTITEAHLYQLLLDRLPNCTLISVAHREALRAFHTHVLDLNPDQDFATSTEAINFPATETKNV